MAKVNIIEADDGARVLYQKKTNSDITSVAIGFVCGAQCDPKGKEGLAHFLEHMLNIGGSEKFHNELASASRNLMINQNAFTSNDAIMITFDVHNDDFEEAIDNCMKMLCNREFSPELMENEMKVICEEIRMISDEEYDDDDIEDQYYGEDGLSVLLKRFLNNSNKRKVPKRNLLGTKTTLKRVTPQDFQEYMHTFFNRQNFVFSVSTRIPEKRIKEIVDTAILPKLESQPQGIVDFEEKTHDYNKNNMLYLNPIEDVNTITINYLLKIRDGYSDDYEKELAYQYVIDKLIGGGIGSYVFNKFRGEGTSLSYYSQLSTLECGDYCFAHFQLQTGPKKIKKCFDKISEIICDLRENGVDKNMFESAKKRLINEYRLTHIDKPSALDNAFMFMNGAIFVDNDKIGKYIEQMTFDDFNDYIKTVFSAVDMLASVEGNFDTRDCYNIIELEEKLGNFSNFDCKASFNKPIIQASMSTEEYNEQEEQTIESEL